jgi:hypothetical protein
MNTRRLMVAAALVAILGGLVPALADTAGGTQPMPGQAMDGRMGHGMSGGKMSGPDMSGCMNMMRSMIGRDGRPNSQWQKRAPAQRTMPN